MAAILSESFNYSSTTAMGRRWQVEDNNAATDIITGRFEKAIKIEGYYPNGRDFVALPFTAGSNVVFFGFAFKVNNTSGVEVTTNLSQFPDMFSWFKGINKQGSIKLYPDPARFMIHDTTSTSTAIAYSQYIFDPETWYWVDIKINFVNSGSITVKINGITDPNISALSGDFQGAGGAGVDAFQIGTGDNIANSLNNWSVAVCDLIIYDDTGSLNNDFLGDSKIVIRRPDGVGTYTDWDPTGAANNWDCVNDTTADDDTTYVSTSTASEKDTYTFEDISGSPTIHFIQQVVHARKDDVGARTIKLGCISGATESFGSDVGITADYMVATRVLETDPDTAAAWDATGYNAAEFGQQATS